MKNLIKVMIIGFVFGAFSVCLPEIKLIKTEGNLATIDVGGKQLSRSVIDIRGNNVGLDENDTCAVVEAYQEGDKNYPLRIVCKSGKQFDKVGYLIGSATGTPPHLEYSNYIGQLLHEKAGQMPGQAQRTIYCDGVCQKK